ncbi:MAG: acetyl-CoA C-acetyltransferase [Deltaproteobacteria bacterium]|nr:acetyl-CoA C-acetyltransferase [Deltaproteobacteria bacterium]
MESTVIVSAARTPMGSFLGSLKDVPASQLGAAAIKEAVRRAGVEAAQVEEVVMGNVLMAGQGQAPARQATIHAGLPLGTYAHTINKMCGSGMKAVMLADQAIRVGDRSVMVAGGMESMSQAPMLLAKAREGYRMGHAQMIDSMIHDGLWDAYNNKHMGSCAELCATKYDFGRAAQDQFAADSYRKAQTSVKSGRFKREIVEVSVPQRKGDPVIVSEDEEPGRGDIDKLGGLRAAFEKNGTITAGNASTINDGAAALVLMGEKRARELGMKPLARIVGQAEASLDPEWFTMGPAAACENLLKKISWKKEDVDLWELNEAFSIVGLANVKKLGIDPARVNIRGGAVALGHPIGASGARIIVTLIHALQDEKKKRGVASLCIGGGEGVAVAIEMI